ncbi:transporter [Psychrobacillus sp. NPDC058041]|uniref:transporter n=1 Tax=Psychrobacillus sp. NPDC058041 TaxID=3346310 RepID=UPI0036D8D38E
MNDQFPYFQGQQGYPSGSMMPTYGQYPGQYPGQFPAQYPSQNPGQLPGQYPSQYPGQIPGQYPSQYPGQIPGQQQLPQESEHPSLPSFPPIDSPESQREAPTSPPPSFVPQKQNVGAYAVDSGSIRGCLHHNTYVWLTNGSAFWLYPTFVGRNSISGFRWNGHTWTYYGTDLNRISSFQCY